MLIFGYLKSASLESLATDPVSAQGKIFFNSNDSVIRFDNGSMFKNVVDTTTAQPILNKTSFVVDNIKIWANEIKTESVNSDLNITPFTSLEVDSEILIQHETTPAAPDTSHIKMYAKADDSLYILDNTLVETVVTSGGATTFTDNVTFFQNSTDPTKQFQFELSALTTGITRLFTIPNTSNSTIVGDSASQTITNKTLLEVDNVRFNGDAIESISSNSNIEFSATGSGIQAVSFPKEIDLAHQSTITTPSASRLAVYAKSDNRVYRKTSAGVESPLVGLATTTGIAGLINPYADQGVLYGGTWTPSFTSLSGFSTVTNGGHYYVRIGNVVLCWGYVSGNFTATSPCTYRLSLPLAPTSFTIVARGSGTGSLHNSIPNFMPVSLTSVASTVLMQVAVTNGGLSSGTYEITYQFGYTLT